MKQKVARVWVASELWVLIPAFAYIVWLIATSTPSR